VQQMVQLSVAQHLQLSTPAAHLVNQPCRDQQKPTAARHLCNEWTDPSATPIHHRHCQQHVHEARAGSDTSRVIQTYIQSEGVVKETATLLDDAKRVVPSCIAATGTQHVLPCQFIQAPLDCSAMNVTSRPLTAPIT
jgi:hypothetical protein